MSECLNVRIRVPVVAFQTDASPASVPIASHFPVVQRAMDEIGKVVLKNGDHFSGR